MALLPILTAPDARLKQISRPVDNVDDEVRELMADMLETMYAAPGIGLAAPQVGVLRRVIVVDVALRAAAEDGEAEDETEGETGGNQILPNPVRMANPELVWIADEDDSYEEGCLSLPEHYAEVARPRAIRVQYLDHTNEIRELEADGLLATCIQHEIDHLDGILFVDHISALKRGMILRKLLKEKKQRAQELATP